jgi:hypothetical protein
MSGFPHRQRRVSNSRRRLARRQPLHLERLEPRAMLAVSVTIDTPQQAGFDTGKPGDNITNVASPTFQGTATTGATVTVERRTIGDTRGEWLPLNSPVTADAVTGIWEVSSLSPFAEGVHEVRAVASLDVDFGETRPLTFRVDTVRPTIKVTPNLTELPIGGSAVLTFELSEPVWAESGAGPFKASDITVTLTRGSEAESPSITNFAEVPGTEGREFTAVFTPPPGGDPTYSILVPSGRFQDVAGNANLASNTLSIVSFGRAPELTITRSGVGLVKAGDTVTLTFDLTAASGDFAFGDVLVVDTEGNPAGQITPLDPDAILGNRRFTTVFTPQQNFEGVALISVPAGKFTDPAGNLNVLSNQIQLTIDTLVPASPTAPTLAAETDNGRFNDDSITNVTRPRLIGRATFEEGLQIEVFAQKVGVAGATPRSLGRAVVDESGDWQLVVSAGSSLQDGDGQYAITARSIDAAGNVSPASPELVITLDTTQPAVSPAELAPGSDSGDPTDRVTNVTQPTLQGTADPDALVTVSLASVGADPVVLTTLTGPEGAWAVTPENPLADGVWTATVVAEDVAGNSRTAAAPNLQFTIRTVKPAAPSKPDLIDLSDSGIANGDDVTNVTTPSFAGTAPVGTTVEVFVRNPGDEVSSLSQGVAVDPVTGEWSNAVTFAQAFTRDGVYQVFARATDTEGNVSDDSAVLEVTVDTTRPRLTGIAQPLTPRALPVATIAVTFSEEVFGLTLADVVLEYRSTPDRSPIRLSLGGQARVVKDTNDPRDVRIEGLEAFTGSTGGYELRIVPTGPITDRAGNALVSPTLPPVRWQTDVTAPRVVRFGPVTPALRNIPVTSVAVEFSETVTGVTPDDFRLLRDGQPVVWNEVTVGGSGRNWSINGLAPFTNLDGSYTLRLVAAGSGIEDLVGNPLSFDAEVSWTMDATAPTGGFLPVVSPVGAGIDAVVLEFTGPVTGLGKNDFTLTRNGAPLDLGLATLSPAGGPAARYVLSGLRQLTGVDGVYEVSVNVGGGTPVQDEVGNLVDSVDPLTWTVDTRVPVATWRGVPAVTRNAVTTATLTFSLPVGGVDPSDFLLTRVRPDGTIESLSGFTVSASGTAWSVNLGSLANVDGTYRLRLVAGGSGIARTDAPFNPLRDDATVEWIQDATAPTVALSQLSWDGGRMFRVRAVFSERVTGLDADNLQVVGGTASNLVPIGTSGRDYRFDVTLPAAPANPATVTVPTGIVSDAAGNANIVSAPLPLVTDFTAPRVTLSGPAVTTASPFEVIATFDEPVTGLIPADVLIANGTVTSVTPASGFATTFTLSVVPDGQGLVTLSLPAGAAADPSGNGSTPSNSLQVRHDSVRPGVTLASLSGDPSRNQELRVAVTFDEPVTGLTGADFTVTNGTATRLSGSGRDYVLFVEPNLHTAFTGIVVGVSLPADAAQDEAGNLSLAGSLQIRSDLVPPRAALTGLGDGRIRIRFTEDVTGLDLTDFLLTSGGRVTSLRNASLSLENPRDTWEIDLLVALAGAAPGRYELRLVAAGSGIVDWAGNSLAADATLEFEIDGEAPVATWIGVPALTNEPLASAVLRFSEPVVGLTAADIVLFRDGIVVVPPGGITIFPITGPAAEYTIGGLAAHTAVEGRYELRLLASGRITDPVGNRLERDAVATWTHDATRPEAFFGPVAISPRLPAVFSTDIFFSEPVVGFDVGDLQIVRDGVALRLAGARVAAVGTSNTQFRISGLDQLTRLAGDYTLTLRAAGSRITDAAGNPLARDASVSWTNAGAPTPGPLTAAFEAVTPNPRSSPVDSVAVTFSAFVIGVDASDFVLERTAGGVTTALTGFTVAGSGVRRTVEGLLPLTDSPGDYSLRLQAAGSGIASVSGQPLTADLVVVWTRRPGPAVAPAVTITTDPLTRPGAAVDAVDLVFNVPVTGVRLAAFRLTRDGIPLSLTGAVLSGSGAGYQLRGLAAIAAVRGTYELRLVAAGSGIADAAGQPLAADGLAAWTVDLAEVRASFLAVEASRTAPLAGVRLRFSTAVLGVDVKDFELTRDGVPVPLFGVTVLGRATSWVIGNLAATQTTPGTYTLRLRAPGSGIVSELGQQLAEDALVTWEVW